MRRRIATTLAAVNRHAALDRATPKRPVFVTTLTNQHPIHATHHLLKAGITGWAQVH